MIWNKEMECMSRSQMENLQLERLKKIVRHAYDNASYYRAKMDAANVKPDDIKTLDDVNKLPFTTKEDLRDNYPLGMLAVPKKDIVRIQASSGTTGKQKVLGYTRGDLDVWSECAARCMAMSGVGEDDILQVAYGYGLFTGGLGAHAAGERVGAMVVPMSTGNTKRLITLMIDLGVTAIACTPSYLLHIAEVLEEEGLIKDIKLKTAVCGAEPWTENMRREIEAKLHCKAHDIYGLTEMMGPGVACDCDERTGLHICEDHFLAEIIDENTLEPLAHGKTGELVFTTLTKMGQPLIRYRTRDLTSLSYEPCKCGRTTARISRFQGRSDDMLIIRGVNVFPSQIEAALLEVKEAAPHYFINVDRVNNMDTLEVLVELKEQYYSDEIRDMEALAAKIANSIKQTIGLAAKIKLVEPNSIERSMGKAVHVCDKRVIK